MLITNQEDFEKFLRIASKTDVVAIDTEFLRDKTYKPKLCLLQFAIKDTCVLVDPFEVDINPLKRLLLNDNVVKLFHSPRQDIEILYNSTGVIPVNIFDTQLAASFLGYPDQIGYANLVQNILNIKLDKSDTYSDWKIRPLKSSQLMYAQNDVTYLLEMYPIIVDMLNQKDRLDWLAQDTQIKFLDKELYIIDPMTRFQHLKRVSSLKGRQLAVAKYLAAWRETKAEKLDKPRKWIMSDELIFEICKSTPKNLDELYNIRRIKKTLNIGFAREVLKAVDKGLSVKDEEIPNLKDNSKQSNKKDNSNSDTESAIDLMSAIVRFRAKENNISPGVLVTSSELCKIVHGATSGIPVLSGWRRQLVGNDLLDLINNRISLSFSNGRISINKNNI